MNNFVFLPFYYCHSPLNQGFQLTKSSAKGGNANSFTKIDPNQASIQLQNLGGYVVEDQGYNYQFQYEDDKIQLEGQDNELAGYGNPNGANYLNIQQQYQPQYMIQQQIIMEPVKQQYNNYNQAIYLNHQAAANTPYIDQQIGLVSNFELQRTQIYSEANNNNIQGGINNAFYNYQLNPMEIPENNIIQENGYTENNNVIEQNDNFVPPVPQLIPASSSKQKKPRASSSKNIQPTSENAKTQSTSKKGKKANNNVDKAQQQEVLQENIPFNNQNTLGEDQIPLIDMNEGNNLIQQEFQIPNVSFERSQNEQQQQQQQPIVSTKKSNQKRKSQQQQQLKEQNSTIENHQTILLQQSNNNNSLNEINNNINTINGVSVQNLIPQQSLQNQEQQLYSAPQEYQPNIQKYSQIIQNSSNEGGLRLIHHNIHLNTQNQQILQQQPQEYIQQQQVDDNNMNEENQNIGDENENKYMNQQQFISYQNPQFIHGHGGIANSAYTFVSNEALGFENKQQIEEGNEYEQKDQQIYQYNNEGGMLQLGSGLNNEENNENNLINYQGNEDLQTPQLAAGKKRYSKKSNKNGNAPADAPPKKQREKKQSTSDKSNPTSSSSTTASTLNQNQLDTQIKFGSEKITIGNETIQLQTQQSDSMKIKIENIPPFSEEQVQYPVDLPEQTITSKIAKEPKKRAPSKRKSKTSILIPNPLDQQSEQRDDMGMQQQSDPVIPNNIEEVQQDIEQQNQNIFGQMNLMENLQKKVEIPSFKQLQQESMWSNKGQPYVYQQQQGNKILIQYHQDNLGLQQMEQNSNMMKGINQIQQQQQHKDEQMQLNVIQKFHHLDPMNQNEYQMMQQQQPSQQQIHSQQLTTSLTSINQNDSYTNIKIPILQQTQSDMLIERKVGSQKKIRAKSRSDRGMEIVQETFVSIQEKTIEEEVEQEDINKLNNQDIDMGMNQQEDDDLDQLGNHQPEKLSKKKSSKASSKAASKKRKVSNIYPELNNSINNINNNNSNSEQDNQMFNIPIENNSGNNNNNMTANNIVNNAPQMKKEKSVNEKKRGIRDLTTEEKWSVFVQYGNLKSYRGVGREFNMDHSTVKLLVHRIQNERPNEVITKDIFLQSQIAQPTLEHSVSKKLKKDKQNQENQKNSKAQPKSDKSIPQETHFSQENVLQEEEDQINLYDQGNNQQQLMMEELPTYQQQTISSQNIQKQDSQIKIEEKIEVNTIPQQQQDEQEEGLPEVTITKTKSKKESSRKSANSKRRSSAAANKQQQQQQQQQEELNEQVQLQQEMPQDQVMQSSIDYQSMHLNQMPLEQNNQESINDKMNPTIKYEQEQYETTNNYGMYQVMNDNDNIQYQQDQNQDNNDQVVSQQQQQQYSNRKIQMENLYEDLNDENKNGNQMNLQIGQQDIDQDLNQVIPPLPETVVRSKSKKMTSEEKKARKEERKLIQQEKAPKTPARPKKGKGKGQQDQAAQMQDYPQDMDQNYEQNYEQNPYYSHQDNQYFYHNYDPNMPYLPHNQYQYQEYNNYQTKYEEDYDINIENLDINNHGHQQQQNNPQSYDNDEIKLELN